MNTKESSFFGRSSNAVGWFAVAMSLVAGCSIGRGVAQRILDEGWAASFLENLGLVALCVLPVSILMVSALLALRWPRIVGLLLILVGGLSEAIMFVGDVSLVSIIYDPQRMDPNRQLHLIAVLLVITGIAYFKGRPRPQWLAIVLVAGLPLAISVISSAEPIWRVLHRQDDGVISARRVVGNGVELIWAPAGPGWPHQGDVSVDEAGKIVSRLNEDGLSVDDSPQNLWRLPTIDEAVRSLTRDAGNAGGQWDPESGQARYRVTPDKESPLWRVHSPVICWWTSSSHTLEGWTYVISFDGRVLIHRSGRYADLGFRAVRER
jgi:hypothetical protein